MVFLFQSFFYSFLKWIEDLLMAASNVYSQSYAAFKNETETPEK